MGAPGWNGVSWPAVQATIVFAFARRICKKRSVRESVSSKWSSGVEGNVSVSSRKSNPPASCAVIKRRKRATPRIATIIAAEAMDVHGFVIIQATAARNARRRPIDGAKGSVCLRWPRERRNRFNSNGEWRKHTALFLRCPQRQINGKMLPQNAINLKNVLFADISRWKKYKIKKSS